MKSLSNRRYAIVGSMASSRAVKRSKTHFRGVAIGDGPLVQVDLHLSPRFIQENLGKRVGCGTSAKIDICGFAKTLRITTL